MPAFSPSNITALYHPRLNAYEHLIDIIRDSDVSGGSIWLDFLERLPVTLGESSADRTVHYSFSDRVHQAILRGVDGLVDLIKRRQDSVYDQDKRGALLPDERMRVSLWPDRFNPRTLTEDSPLRPVVTLTLLETPDLDGGLVESWLSRSAGGASLYYLLRSLTVDALSLAREQPAFSGVALMSHLAHLNTVLQAKSRIKKAQIKNMSYARLERAVGMALHACFSRATREALVGMPPAQKNTKDYIDSVIILSSLGPRPFVSIRKSELSSDVNAYGITEEAIQLLSPAYQSALERNNDPLHLLRECLRAVYGNQATLQDLLPLSICEALRRLVLDHLVAAEDPDSDCDKLLAEIYPDNKAFLAMLDGNKLLTDTITQLKSRIENYRRVDKMMPQTRRLLLALEQHLADEADVRPAGKENIYLQEMVERFLLYRLDEFASAHLDKARMRVIDRRRTVTTSELVQEYESGKLYRIADDDMPVVKARVVSHQGQLFVDLKGYTRRTARSKELVMADFLKTEFYEPILQEAKKYTSGGSLLPEEENIRLVNLLGDAVAFSGNIASLVNLAHDIQAIFREYRRKLEEQAPLEEEEAYQALRRQVEGKRAGLLAEIEELSRQLEPINKEIFQRSSLTPSEMVKQIQEDFKAQFEKLKTQHDALSERKKKASQQEQKEINVMYDRVARAHERLKARRQKVTRELKELKGEELTSRMSDLLCAQQLKSIREIEDRINVLRLEDRSLEEALEHERRLHLGSGLEAGLFISHGATPELITIDDDTWGTRQVSISERINEAARGTARNMAVMAQLHEMLAEAREENANPGLELPFRVFIADTRSFGLDRSVSHLWNQAVSGRDREQLERFLSALREQVEKQFEEADNEDPARSAHVVSDIYNLGEAMSEGALDAYLRQTRHTHFFFRTQVRAAELHPEFSDRFFFPSDILSLIVGRKSAENENVEMFRYVGQVLFRGFEVSRPTPVYEILRPQSPFVRLVVKHHLDAWFEEAQRNPEIKLEGLS